MIKIIIPPHEEKSFPVSSFKSIKEDSKAMIEAIEQNNFQQGVYESAYALTHSQVFYNPRTFFVVNNTIPYIKQVFKSNVIINPEIIEKGEEILHKEACMSMPYRKAEKAWRASTIKVVYYIPGWFGRLKKVVETCDGLKAMIFQHEIEHFHGKY